MKYKIILLPQVKSAPVKLWEEKQYKQEAPLLIITHNRSAAAQVNRNFWQSAATQQLRELCIHCRRRLFSGFQSLESISIFLFYFFIVLRSRNYYLQIKVVGFSPIWVSRVKNTCVIVLSFVYLLEILLINAIKIYCYNIKKI